MILHRTILLCALVVFAAPASAQSVKLSGDEIRILLTGNTAVGRCEGVKYRQYFADDGTTIFAQEGAGSALGGWHVDDDAQEYQNLRFSAH